MDDRWLLHKRKWFALLICLAGSAGVWSQAGVSFEAYADARQVLLRSYFELTFTLRNANGTDFNPPDFKDFDIVAGPSRSVSTTIINGQMSQELSFIYTLQPRRTGKFTIGSASIRVDNKRLSTRPLEIQVLEGKAGGTASEEVFLRAEPSTTMAWVGQQIILDYKLYTTVQIDNYNVVEESEYQGFYAQDIRRFDNRLLREIIDGKEYVTKVIKRMVLFPQRGGALTIDPLNVQLAVATDDPRSRNSFFFNRQIRRIPIVTDPVSIQVRPLPPGAPPSFTGAVGHFEVTAGLNRTAITTDDALSVRLNIRGNGDIKRVQAPEISFPEAFEVYDPKVLQENSFDSEGLLMGEKLIEYLLVPREAGTYPIQPVFSWFDPDSARYVTFTGAATSVEVSPGSQRKGTSSIRSAGKEAPADILDHWKEVTTLKREETYFWGSFLFWALVLLPAAFVAGVFAYRRRVMRLEKMDPALSRLRRAHKVALQRLAQAEKLLNEQRSKEFYNEVERAMDRYLCDKLGIPQAELSLENVRLRLQELQVPEAMTGQFLRIRQTCETALYAGRDHSEAMQETYRDVLEVISAIEAST